jgi:hypothetical protein
MHLFWQGKPGTTTHFSPAAQPPPAVHAVFCAMQEPTLQDSQLLQSASDPQMSGLATHAFLHGEPATTEQILPAPQSLLFEHAGGVVMAMHPPPSQVSQAPHWLLVVHGTFGAQLLKHKPLSPPDLQTLPAPHSKSVVHGTAATPPQTPLSHAWQFGQSANVVQATMHLF